MITDAAIFEATNEVEKAEQELKGLSEALDSRRISVVDLSVVLGMVSCSCSSVSLITWLLL